MTEALHLDHGEWVVTPHAQEQMQERKIELADLDALLWRPERDMPNFEEPDKRIYAGAGIIAVVNERERVVITVGIDGGSKGDWRTTERKTGNVPAVVPRLGEQPTLERRHRKQRQPKAGPVTVSYMPGFEPEPETDDLPASIQREIESLVGAGQRLKRISATEFVIVNTR